MCVIAGYSGKRRAAPILIEMLKKIEYFDGGYATGIATVHEGKIYCAKAIGDVEMLLRTTNALDLPGTTESSTRAQTESFLALRTRTLMRAESLQW